MNLQMTDFPNVTEVFTLSSNGTTSGTEYRRDVLRAAVTCLIIFTIVGVSGNFISIFALARCPRLRNATTAFIINLCVADFVCCSFSTPLHAVMYMQPRWNISESFVCKIFPLVSYGNGFVSLMTVVAITINRYICIVHPTRYAAIYRPFNICAMIATLWMSICLLLSLSLFRVWGEMGYRPETRTCDILLLNGKSPKKLIFEVALGLPSVVFVFCYSRIYWVVRTTSRKIQAMCAPNTMEDVPGTASPYLGRILNDNSQVKETSRILTDKKELKVLKVTAVVFFTYVLCYFPVSLMKLIKKEGELLSLNVAVFMLMYLANCTNPFIYVAMSAEYRKAYVDLFTSIYRKITSYF